MRDLLLVVQIALCAVLVTSSMVAVRGLLRSLHSNFGFEPANTMLVDADVKMAGYSGERVPAHAKTHDRRSGKGSRRGVRRPYRSAAFDHGREYHHCFHRPNADLRPSTAAANPYMYEISPQYFRAAGTTLLAGRTFTWHDDQNSQRVAVVNREFARKVFGSEAKALGGYFKRRSGVRFQVVGIVEDGKYLSLTEDQRPAMFLPMLHQSPSGGTWLVVRSHRDPRQLAPALKSALRDLDVGLPSYIQTWNRAMDGLYFLPASQP